MSVKVEKIEKNVVELEVTVEADKFTQEVNKAAKAMAHKVNVPGFRKGKAPRRLVEQTLGTEALYNEALDKLLGPAYSQAVDESGIFPVDRPEVDLVQIEEGKELIFKAKVTVKPEAELGDYKGLNVEKEAASVDDAQVEQELKNMQEQHARLITLEEEGTVEQGDIVTHDYEGFLDGVPFEGGKGQDYDLTIGSNTFIPGYEEQLVGAKIGQDLDVNVQFPDEYHSDELAGKKVVFKVHIKKIKRKELASLDDEFAKDVSEFETLDELKKDIQKKLLETAEKKAENDYRNAVVAKAVENATVEIPEAMIQARMDSMMEDLNLNLSYQGITLEQYLTFTGVSQEETRERYRPQAESTLKTELVLEAIAKVEGIQVSEEEINEHLTELAARYQQDAEAIKQSLIARGDFELYKQSIIAEKTADFLVEQNV